MLRHTSTIRIYGVKGHVGAVPLRVVYACWRATGRVVRMGTQERSDVGEEFVDVRGLTVAASATSRPSSVIGWSTRYVGGTEGGAQVFSANLRSGRVIHSSDPANLGSGASVDSFIVTSSGSLGWTGVSGRSYCRGVHAIGPDGVQRDLDCAAAVGKGNLRWAGGILSWSYAGMMHSARLA